MKTDANAQTDGHACKYAHVCARTNTYCIPTHAFFHVFMLAVFGLNYDDAHKSHKRSESQPSVVISRGSDFATVPSFISPASIVVVARGS